MLVAAAAAAVVGAGRAQSEIPDPSSSAVSQYAELVPTGSGPKAPGVEPPQAAALAPEARRALESTPSEMASLLATVATSSDYGAPQTPLADAGNDVSGSPSPDEPSLDRTLAATAAAVDDARILGLLVAMVVIALGGGALAVRARRL